MFKNTSLHCLYLISWIEFRLYNIYWYLRKNRTIYQKSIIVRQCKKLLVASSTGANSPFWKLFHVSVGLWYYRAFMKSSRFIHISYKSMGRKNIKDLIRSDTLKTWLKKHQNTVLTKKTSLWLLPHQKKTCQLCHHMPSDNWEPLDPLLEPALPRC